MADRAGEARVTAVPPRAARSAMSGVARLTVTAALGVALVLVGAGLPIAQEVTAPALKAAFLFNFVKFTTWPPEVLPDAAPLVMCVVNDPAVSAALARTVDGRDVLGHQLRVVPSGGGSALRGCHVVYVSGTRSGALEVVSMVRDTAVLTVSDVQGFYAGGGIAQLHVQQGQLRFGIALDAARRARLQISARLMALARQP